MLYAIVALLVIIADQWVKYWVSMSISMASTGEPLIPGILSLVNLQNDGCAFSLLSGGGARIYFIILTGVFTVAVIIALATRFISGPVSRWSIVLVTAGGLSNCIDRVIYGYVQDMFKLELFNFPVFNVADIFITVCCIIFVLAIIFEKTPKDEYDDEFADEDDEEEDRPKRKSKKQLAAAEGEIEAPAKPLKGKKKAQDQYDQYKAARAARPAAPAPQPQRRPKQTPDGSDPFAEWEKASAKVEAQQKNTYAARATGVAPSSYTRPQARYNAPAQSAARPAAPRPARPVRPAAPAAPQAPIAPQAPVRPQMPVEPVQPVQSAPVQPRPQEKAPADNGLDFNLDDILNEFK